MVSTPTTKGKVIAEVRFNLTGERDWGYLFSHAEFKGMMNGGYTVRLELYDSGFSLLDTLIESGYLQHSRTDPWFYCDFKLKWGPDGEYPKSATRTKRFYVTALEPYGNGSSAAHVSFIGIDPPSWFLNMGDAFGGSFKGKVSDAIKQVVQKYAPQIELTVGETTDSRHNRWWMMRQDPKTFIASLLDWSSALTQQQTQWLIASDNNKLMIKEQGQLQSRQRAFYRFWTHDTPPTIRSWSMMADNAMSLLNTKLVTHGISATSGGYYDRISDRNEAHVFIKDSNTANKRVARTDETQAFTKPPEAAPPRVGWTSIPPIPEIYSGGELGKPYQEYVDGRSRGLYLNLNNRVMRSVFDCLGHGEWDNCWGLGVDTAYIKWMTSDNDYWFMTGNWIVYGFHHVANPADWFTKLYCARADHDAAGVQVGGTRPQ